MMAPQQKQLWRQTAWVGIWVGLVGMFTLLIDVSLGLNQAFFYKAMTTGVAPALVNPQSSLEFGLLAFLGAILFIPRLLLGALNLIMLRYCWIPGDRILVIEIFRLVVTGIACLAVLSGSVQLIQFFYMQDEERYIMAAFVKTNNLLIGLLVIVGMSFIMYYAHSQIPQVLKASILLTLAAALIYTPLSADPKLTSFFGIFIAYIGGMQLSFYMLWKTYLQSDTTQTLGSKP